MTQKVDFARPWRGAASIFPDNLTLCVKPTYPKNPITYNGLSLQWSIRHLPQWSQEDRGYLGLTLVVDSPEANSRPLVIQYPFTPSPRHHRSHQKNPRVTNDEVLRHIETAVGLGWEPESRGKPFLMQLEDEDVPKKRN